MAFMEKKSRQGPTGELGPHMGQWEPLFPSVNHVDPSSSEAEEVREPVSKEEVTLFKFTVFLPIPGLQQQSCHPCPHLQWISHGQLSWFLPPEPET